MNSLKVTIACTMLLLILLSIFAVQRSYQKHTINTFTCYANMSIFKETRNFIGSIQFTAKQNKGAIIVMGIYTDEKGIRRLVSIHNELNHFSRHDDFYALQFSKATFVPHTLSTESELKSMFHPYLLNGYEGKMFYNIFTQPNGNKSIGFGKIPELVCQTPH